MAVWWLAATLISGCGEAPRSADGSPSSGPGETATPAAGSAAGGAAATEWFTSHAADIGLDFVHFNGMSGRFYFPEMIPPGVALLDYDNDGDLDVFVVQGEMLGDALSEAWPATASPPRSRLYRNDLEVHADGTRSLHFTDVTDASHIDARGYGMGVATGDVDNNGCIDLYLTYFGRNQLFRNNCDGTFTDVSKASGTDTAGWSVSATFVDYDRDGWLDLYVGTYSQYDIKSDLKCTGLTGKRDYCTPAVYPAQSDHLYRNRGDGTFTDVTAKALLGARFGPALGVVAADLDNDGWMDLFVANDGRDNLLWMNQRNGTFKNTALLSGAALGENGKPEASMGITAGDFDHDGNEDLFTTHLPGEGANLYVNDGHGVFEDQSARSGLGPFSLGFTGFGTAWFDYDNDGWLDLITVNGAIQAIDGRGNDPFPYSERKQLFRNLGNGRFEDVTRQAGSVFQIPEISRGAAFGDIDNDGDVDVLVGNLNGRVRLLLNNVGNRNHHVCLKLVGTRGRRDMLGARVEVLRKDAAPLVSRVRTDGSYASANDPRVMVGLGTSTAAPGVRVRWPDGRVEEWPEVAVDRCTTLQQGASR
jgi:hypothetical protein